MNAPRQLKLGMFLRPAGHHIAGWRHPDAWWPNTMNFDHAIEIAKLAEAGKLDLLFLADGNAVRQMDKPTLFAANSPTDRPAVFEPLTLLAAGLMIVTAVPVGEVVRP